MPWLNMLISIPGLRSLLERLGNAITRAEAYQKGRADANRKAELEDARRQLEAKELARRVQEELRRLPAAERDGVHRRHTSHDR